LAAWRDIVYSAPHRSGVLTGRGDGLVLARDHPTCKRRGRGTANKKGG
jgi:hypothetical protein